MLAQRVRLPYALALGSLLVPFAGAFGWSYAQLSPLAGSESPESVLLLIPLAALLLIARDLRTPERHAEEFAVNLTFALPFILTAVFLLVWLPARLSYAYWLYRLDLLAVPFFLAAALILVFGVPAAWSARRGFVLLLLGWPPVVDVLVRHLAPPLARVETAIVGLVMSPFGVETSGVVFRLGSGSTLSLSSECAGLVAVFSAALVGGVVALAIPGERRARLRWLGFAIALALAANVVRLTAVVAAGAISGVGAAFDVFHAAAGVVVFAVSFAVALALLPRFGLRLVPPRTEGEPVAFRRRGLAGTAAVLLTLAALGAWATISSGDAGAGLYRGVPALTARFVLVPPPGWRIAGVDRLPWVARVFGGDARAAAYHLTGPDGQAVAAQVIVTRSYRRARRYGAVECFAYHDYRLYSTRFAALGDGGTTALVSLRIGSNLVATSSWVQPVLVDGGRAWRRVVLFQYLRGARPSDVLPTPKGGSIGLWLVNHLSPYGGPQPPPAFRPAEHGLLQLSARLAAAGVVGASG